MQKTIYWMAILLTSFSLVGCQSKKAVSSSAPKTVIKSNQLTQKQRQKQFNAICEQVMKPVTAAAYGAKLPELVTDAKQGKQRLADIQLILQNNTSQPDANQRLLTYIDKATHVLDALIQNDGKAYQNSINVFSNQTTAIARQDYNGTVPPSMVSYAKLHQSNTK
ncbi:hypothetical protein [Lacticaseibacillus saniviri]